MDLPRSNNLHNSRWSGLLRNAAVNQIQNQKAVIIPKGEWFSLQADQFLCESQLFGVFFLSRVELIKIKTLQLISSPMCLRCRCVRTTGRLRCAHEGDWLNRGRATDGAGRGGGGASQQRGELVLYGLFIPSWKGFVGQWRWKESDLEMTQMSHDATLSLTTRNPFSRLFLLWIISSHFQGHRLVQCEE